MKTQRRSVEKTVRDIRRRTRKNIQQKLRYILCLKACVEKKGLLSYVAKKDSISMFTTVGRKTFFFDVKAI